MSSRQIYRAEMPISGGDLIVAGYPADGRSASTVQLASYDGPATVTLYCSADQARELARALTEVADAIDDAAAAAATLPLPMGGAS